MARDVLRLGVLFEGICAEFPRSGHRKSYHRKSYAQGIVWVGSVCRVAVSTLALLLGNNRPVSEELMKASSLDV